MTAREAGHVEFEQFVSAQLPKLVRFATALCADRALGEDIVQDVLVRLHGRWDRMAEVDSPEAYVRRAVVNEYVSWRRKWARWVPHADVPDGGVATDFAEEHASRSELAGELAALPARQRAVLVLRYYGGLSDEEIARVLGCRASTVRAYASRALASLRVEMTDPLTMQMRSHDAY
jgi:RNA polymerase sigma-70 factor (sigma-E family)